MNLILMIHKQYNLLSKLSLQELDRQLSKMVEILNLFHLTNKQDY